MTHQQTSERFENAQSLVKNTVCLQEAENGALLCSMEIANKPRSIIADWWPGGLRSENLGFYRKLLINRPEVCSENQGQVKESPRKNKTRLRNLEKY